MCIQTSGSKSSDVNGTLTVLLAERRVTRENRPSATRQHATRGGPGMQAEQSAGELRVGSQEFGELGDERH